MSKKQGIQIDSRRTEGALRPGGETRKEMKDERTHRRLVFIFNTVPVGKMVPKYFQTTTAQRASRFPSNLLHPEIQYKVSLLFWQQTTYLRWHWWLLRKMRKERSSRRRSGYGRSGRFHQSHALDLEVKRPCTRMHFVRHFVQGHV